MKVLFKDMDVFKAVIVGSLLAIVGLVGWGWFLYEDFEKGTTAMSRARTDVVDLSAKQAQITRLKAGGPQNSGKIDDRSPALYFQTILGDYARFADASAFSITSDSDKPHPSLKGIYEQDWTIDFNKDRNAKNRQFLSRNTVWTICYHAEAFSPRIKLRSLAMRAKETLAAQQTGGKRAYPESLSDEWLVERLVFVERKAKGK